MPAFYRLPADASTKTPGTLLKAETVAAPGVVGTAYRVMYVSTNVDGQPAAVTGVIFVPPTPPPSDGYPVVSWAHGTNGIADECAPSLDPQDVLPATILNEMLTRGWEVAATDYQGEGTPPWILPYLVGSVAAEDAIDIVRAARQLSAAHAGASYVVWGHSEGGQTAMFAWKLGPTYGSQSGLHLLGVVAGAPPSRLYGIYNTVTGPNRVFLYMAIAGYNSAYGGRKAPLSGILTALGRRLLPDLTQGCLTQVQALVDRYPGMQLMDGDPNAIHSWNTLLTVNDPAAFSSASKIPLLIIQGGDDQIVSVSSTASLTGFLCSEGGDVERWLYPGLSHAGVVLVSAGDMTQWMSDRFAGGASPDPYVPIGEPDIQVTTCAQLLG